MLNRKCPCCKEKFSFKDYLQQVVNFKVKKSLNESDPDIVCQKCKNIISPINSSYKYFIGIIPLFFFYDLVYEYFLNYEYIVLYILSLFFLLGISFYIVYLIFPLACDKKRNI